MDVLYEKPSNTVDPPPPGEGDDGGASSGDEDMLDWTKLLGSSSRVNIPKRGEKDFEPAPGSRLQDYTLNRSRGAMVSALKGLRGTSSKNMSYAVWLPGILRAQVFQARGIHFNHMGHSVRRLTKYDPHETPRSVTRLELLPEEALYLIERGSLTCYKASTEDDGISSLTSSGDPSLSTRTATISVQQAYAEMIDKEDLTLEKYQCYSYLKRLGFIVTRAVAPPSSPTYPLYNHEKSSSPSSIWSKIFNRLRQVLSYIPRILTSSPNDWSKPLWRRSSGWLTTCDYPAIFRHLRFIPAGHSNPLEIKQSNDNASPYEIFYHIWKPNSTWKKTAPPYPDFKLIVIDGRTTPVPSIHELTAVFGTLPQVPPPLPRRKNPPPPPLPSPPFTLKNLLTLVWIKSRLFTPAPVLPTPHPFTAVRAGHKSVVIGVVDAGTLSFFRFAEGCFEEWPII